MKKNSPEFLGDHIHDASGYELLLKFSFVWQTIRLMQVVKIWLELPEEVDELRVRDGELSYKDFNQEDDWLDFLTSTYPISRVGCTH